MIRLLTRAIRHGQARRIERRRARAIAAIWSARLRGDTRSLHAATNEAQRLTTLALRAEARR